MSDTDDQPITVEEVERELVAQYERAVRPRPLTDLEREEQIEQDLRAVLTFGPEAWPPDPPNPDET